MAMLRRDEISWNERYRRSLYYFLRDELDAQLISQALIESYKQFRKEDAEYPFVEMRELKPRAKIIAPEYKLHRHFMVIFNEESLNPEAKNHIRFFDSNKVTKDNLGKLGIYDIQEVFHHRMRFFDDPGFSELLTSLLESDFAVLIQRDPTVKSWHRFALSHFRVRIDWPVAEAAEDLGRQLRYVSKHLYEKGDSVGDMLQQKIYEYYGFHHTVGGRRTAALVAAQYMQRFDYMSTVYVASSEARTLCRMAESGISKYVLIQIDADTITELAKEWCEDEKEFTSTYLIDHTPEYGVGIFLVTYRRNEHSTPPPDGKLRDLNPDYPWLRVEGQLLVPPPENADARPIPFSRVYL